MKLDFKYRCKNKGINGDLTVGKYYKIYHISYSTIYKDNLYWFMNDFSEPMFVTPETSWEIFDNEKTVRKEKLIEINESCLYKQ